MQRLIFNEKLLKDGKTLPELNIYNRSTIQLVYRKTIKFQIRRYGIPEWDSKSTKGSNYLIKYVLNFSTNKKNYTLKIFSINLMNLINCFIIDHL